MNFIPTDDLYDSWNISAFTGTSTSDPDEPTKCYRFPELSGQSSDAIVQAFIEERLEWNEYEGLHTISESRAAKLLRQMAMFKMDSRNRKEQSHSSVSAKELTTELLAAMGKKVEFYTNADSLENPHDRPGRVTFNQELYGFCDSICFIGINKEYFLFMEQAWNFQGE